MIQCNLSERESLRRGHATSTETCETNSEDIHINVYFYRLSILVSKCKQKFIAPLTGVRFLLLLYLLTTPKESSVIVMGGDVCKWFRKLFFIYLGHYEAQCLQHEIQTLSGYKSLHLSIFLYRNFKRVFLKTLVFKLM